MAGNNHLSDALTVIDDKILLRQIDEYDTYLTTIVGIDGARSVQYGQTML